MNWTAFWLAESLMVAFLIVWLWYLGLGRGRYCPQCGYNRMAGPRAKWCEVHGVRLVKHSEEKVLTKCQGGHVTKERKPGKYGSLPKFCKRCGLPLTWAISQSKEKRE